MKVALISTYELGRQPFGVASPAAWLAARGHEALCVDTTHERLPVEAVAAADLIAFYLPMHTATRLAVPLIERVLRERPDAHVCCYGLYAPMNEPYLRALGVRTVIGGEFEAALAALAEGGAAPEGISLERLRFITPDRSGLPALRSYAKLERGGLQVIAGSTEASRGCKYLCRHCPVVPVYNGAFRVVQREVVLEDIRRQVAQGAGHITFGDPDFFNGPAHSMAIVEQLHAEFPDVTYDVTIKIEHLLKHRALLARLRTTGCLFVTSAVESLSDRILELLDKGHTRADFLEATRLARDAGLTLTPTFVAFTPWTTIGDYRDILETLVELDLVDHVAPVQLAIRLLIPAGSRLLELPELRERIGDFDAGALSYAWTHPLDGLAAEIQRVAQEEAPRREVFARIWKLAHDRPVPESLLRPGAPVPRLSEPWYCCAEPTPQQLAAV